MIYSEAKTARIHGVKFIRVEAKEVREAKISWLSIITDIGDEITFFMPYEAALEYANAINGCIGGKTAENCPFCGGTKPDNHDPMCGLNYAR